MSENELLQYIESLSSTYEAWLALMRFGVGTIAPKGLFALELIVREAERNRCGSPQFHCVADRVVRITRDLGWDVKFTETPSVNTTEVPAGGGS